MDQPPRDPRQSFLTRRLFVRVALVGALMLAARVRLFEWARHRGQSRACARTVAVNVFIFIEIFYLFSARALRRSIWQVNPFGNRVLLAGVLLMIGLQLLFTYLPLMNRMFHSAPIDAASWVAVLAAALASL